MRISSSATQNGVLRSGCFKIAPTPTPPLPKKVSLIIVRQFCCFSGLPNMHIYVFLQILCKTVIARKIIMNLYNYALVK